MVVESEIFPAVLSSLRDPDDYVIKNVATLIREIAKHTPEVRRERERCGNAVSAQEHKNCTVKILSLIFMSILENLTAKHNS